MRVEDMYSIAVRHQKVVNSRLVHFWPPCGVLRRIGARVAISVVALGIALPLQSQSVSDGASLYGGKGCANGGCHGPSTDLRNIRNASNNPGKITEAINRRNDDGSARIPGMQNLGLSPANLRSLGLYIGQFKSPLPLDTDLTLLSNTAASKNIYPLLVETGGSGAAADNGLGVTAPTAAGGMVSASIVPHPDAARATVQYNISYTPGVDFAGDDIIHYKLTNPAAPGGVSQQVAVKVVGITSGSTVNGTQGKSLSYSITINESGSGAPFTATNLPNGLRLNPTGTITGIPTTITGSSPVSVVIEATTSLGKAHKTLSFVVGAADAPNAGNLDANLPQTTVPFQSQGFNIELPVTGGFDNRITDLTSVDGIGGALTLRTEQIEDGSKRFIVTYKPRFDECGAASFKYTVANNNNLSREGVIKLNVLPPAPPQVGNDFRIDNVSATGIDITLPVVGGFQNTITVPPKSAGLKDNKGVDRGEATLSQPFGNTSLIVRYIPPVDGFGVDTFTYSATAKGNKAVTGTVTIVVSAVPPTASQAFMTVELNTPSEPFDLKRFVTGSAISGIKITKLPIHGTVTTNGTSVVYKPKHNYFGSDSFVYRAIGFLGESPEGVVKVAVSGRPDPSNDPHVVGLIGAQVDAARRFSRAQISNVQGRLETLHQDHLNSADSSYVANTRSARSELRRQITIDSSAAQSVPATSRIPSTHANAAEIGTFGTQLDKSSFASLAARSVEAALTDIAPSWPYRSLLSSLLSISQSRTFNLASLGTNDAISTGTGIWMAGNIGFGDRNASGSRSETKFSTGGISIGIDRKYAENLAVGVGLGYARDRTEIGADGSESRARSTTLSLYGSYQPLRRNIFLDGLIGYGVLDYDTQRFVEPLTEVNQDPNIQPAKHFARASRDGNQLFGSIAVGYQSPLSSGFLWSPYARLDFSRSHLEQASETGAGQYELTYFKQSVTEADLSLGLRAQWEHELNPDRGGVALPYARLEYTRNLKGDSRATIAYSDLVDGARYSVPSVGGDRDALTLGVGSDFVLCNGASLGIDYQFRHSSGQENSQALQFRLAKALGAPGRSCKASEDSAPPNLRVTVDAAVTYDDNVTKARNGAGQLSDELFSLKGTKELELFKFGRFGLVVSGSLGGEAFRHYSDLGHIFGEIQGELRYPAYSPNIALFVRSGLDHYKSHIRSGYNYSTGIVLQRNFIQHGVGVTAQIAHNVRYSDSSVFDLSDNSAQLGVSYSLNKDLSTGKADVLYLSGEFRRGDVVSTERESLANLNIADVFVSDDAFGRADLFSYRFDARTTALNIGYIKPLGSGHLDISWTHVRSTSTDSSFAGGGSGRYVDNQIKLVYVLHFGTWNRMGRFRAY